MRALITGGAGFIGAAFCRRAHALGWRLLNLDALTYAASLAALPAETQTIQGDVCDRPLLARLLDEHRPQAIVHFAAETHVDRSIDAADAFVRTNVVGTLQLLEAALAYWRRLPAGEAAHFRLLHVSTDEVFGSLEPGAPAFTENTPYQPRSPYAASKAAADHLVRAYAHTHGLPALISNCSNNYGPYQFPEKLIPLMILAALEGRELPVYGDGAQIRDWLFVEDHVEALLAQLQGAAPGSTYLVGARCERTNLQVVEAICDELDAAVPGSTPRRKLIRFVTDRPGHDRRYAIDCTRMEQDLGWKARTLFEEGLARTVRWYVANASWWAPIRARRYDGARLGLGGST